MFQVFRIGVAMCFLSTPSFAQQLLAPKSYVLTAPLVEELFQRLSTAALVTMLQTEVQHQPPPITCPEQQQKILPDGAKDK